MPLPRFSRAPGLALAGLALVGGALAASCDESGDATPDASAGGSAAGSGGSAADASAAGGSAGTAGGASGTGGAGTGGSSGDAGTGAATAGSAGKAGSGASGGASSGGTGGGSGGAGGGAGSAGAAPEHYWTLQPGAPSLDDPQCNPANGGQTSFVHARLVLKSTCEHAGPIVADVDAGTFIVTLHMSTWVEHGVACVKQERVEPRIVTIPPLELGLWLVKDGQGGGQLSLLVSSPPPASACDAPAARGAACTADCGCNAGVCLPDWDDAGCVELCAEPCNGDFDCAPGDVCLGGSGGLRHLGPPTHCAARSSDGCAAGCPAGTACVTPGSGEPYCDYVLTLDAAARHACTTEGDCIPGMKCVEGDDASRHCELPCWNAGQRCPTGSACVRDATVGSAHWVCEPS